jgi:L-ascorbate metabolism protein UlaG (beta-lactamase superfamily)
LTRDGAVKAFGDARYRGGARKYSMRATAVAPTPTGKGYWILARGGRVFAMGDAEHFGGRRGSGSRWTDLAPTPTGSGYRLFSAAGAVAAFGDATHLGDALDAGLQSRVAAGIAHGAAGYWIVTERGRILSFGDAPAFEPLKLAGPGASIADAAATSTGAGLWLAGELGKIYERGDAQSLRVEQERGRSFDLSLIPEPDSHLHSDGSAG